MTSVQSCIIIVTISIILWRHSSSSISLGVFVNYQKLCANISETSPYISVPPLITFSHYIHVNVVQQTRGESGEVHCDGCLCVASDILVVQVVMLYVHPSINPLKPDSLNCYTLPYRPNPPFLISDIWALWRSGLSARVPKCQKLKMVG